jgi:hypothetical protein
VKENNPLHVKNQFLRDFFLASEDMAVNRKGTQQGRPSPTPFQLSAEEKKHMKY